MQLILKHKFLIILEVLCVVGFFGVFVRNWFVYDFLAKYISISPYLMAIFLDIAVISPLVYRAYWTKVSAQTRLYLTFLALFLAIIVPLLLFFVLVILGEVLS